MAGSKYQRTVKLAGLNSLPAPLWNRWSSSGIGVSGASSDASVRCEDPKQSSGGGETLPAENR